MRTHSGAASRVADPQAGENLRPAFVEAVTRSRARYPCAHHRGAIRWNEWWTVSEVSARTCCVFGHISQTSCIVLCSSIYLRRSRVFPSPARDDPPLVSCLTNHDGPSSSAASSPTSGFSRPTISRRRSSLTTPPQADVVTIPLRPCCVNCEYVWEESQKEGEQWKEKFTRGARRLRSLSADARPVVHHRHGSLDSTNSFDHPPVLTIKVDEVDKRKSSVDCRPLAVDPTSPIDIPADAERRHASDSSVPSCNTTVGRVRTPIPEDDEDQLFPLPLNRRSPSASPSGSSSSLHATGQKTSPSSSRESIPQRTRIPSPIKSNRVKSPPPPSPITKSLSAPLPQKSLSRSLRSGLPSDRSYLDSETILGPSITRDTRTSPKKSKLWSTGVSITKAAGAGILKGVSNMSVGPGTHLA